MALALRYVSYVIAYWLHNAYCTYSIYLFVKGV